ncbi:hypothetical protein [Actinomadura darangshiensis]|uniref:hypothetical protein n=1 Tax=Actinomadura darangshiensis TaxID=705336 RepID=UPI00140CB031|nr:hypothetical protein [Actinomadura darangshiensis]
MIAAAGVLALALAGCGDGGNAKEQGAGGSSLKPAAQGPPAGGWPQPENGRLTDKMCGLLTNADYAKYGHQLMPLIDQPAGGNGTTAKANTVGCLHLLGDSMSLSLHESAKAAELVFEQDLDRHKTEMKSPSGNSVFATGVVQGMDESWFDRKTPAMSDEYTVAARRGSLVVELTLDGNPQKPDKDPRGALSGLASLVFQRLPNVGTSDTAPTHRVRYLLTGIGKAKQVVYEDPETQKQVELHNVKLPWRSRTFSVAEPGTTVIGLLVSGIYPMQKASAPMACKIFLDDRPVDQKSATGTASCDHTYGT